MNFYRKVFTVKIALLFCLSGEASHQKPCVSVMGESTYKKILKAVKRPQTFETEKELKQAGFQAKDVAGLDEVYYLRAIAKSLKNPWVDLKRTHIEDFANKIEKHIQFFKQGLRKTGETNAVVLRGLDRLISIARTKKKNRQVTYEWWLKWNIHMVSVIDTTTGGGMGGPLSSGDSKKNITTEMLRANMVFLPTVKTLSQMAFNRAFPFIAPLQLVYQPTYENLEELDPVAFLEHDIDHGLIQTSLYHRGFEKKKLKGELIYKWEKNIKLLPMEKRKKIENLWFAHFHEQQFFPELDTMIYGSQRDIITLFYHTILMRIIYDGGRDVVGLEDTLGVLPDPLNKEILTVSQKILKYRNNHITSKDVDTSDQALIKKMIPLSLRKALKNWVKKQAGDFASFVSEINFHKTNPQINEVIPGLEI